MREGRRKGGKSLTHEEHDSGRWKSTSKISRGHVIGASGSGIDFMAKGFFKKDVVKVSPLLNMSNMNLPVPVFDATPAEVRLWMTQVLEVCSSGYDVRNSDNI